MVTQLRDAPVTLQKEDLASQLQLEYQAQETLFHIQPPRVQRMLELQARLVAKAMVDRLSPLYFTLPDQVFCKVDGTGEWVALTVPQDQQEQKVGGLMDILEYSEFRQRLLELEASLEQALSTTARLLRHAIAMHMAHTMLPVASRDEVHEPFTSWAGRVFIPQWTAFDEQDNLLVNSMDEARACIDSMQRYLSILKVAIGLAPYIVADLEYQQRQSRVLGQLITQGRSLARHETGEIIRTIQRRAATHNLNRGLRLRLPYFDDRLLEIGFQEIQVIPAGRVMFVAAFVVLASKLEQIKVEHDPQLSPSTRKHLLEELKTLELAFDNNSCKQR
jgi:hypothetical protein